jgi:hypothetical protein
MPVVRFMTGALRGEAFLPRSLITRNYVKQCAVHLCAETVYTVCTNSVQYTCVQKQCILCAETVYTVCRNSVHCVQKQCTLCAQTVCSTLVCRNSVHCVQKQCTLCAETVYTVCRNSVHCVQKPECSSPLELDLRPVYLRFVARSGTGIGFSYSSSIFLCHYHSNSASYHTSFRSYRLCRIFAADSFVERNTTFCLSHSHARTFMLCFVLY